MRFYCKSCNSEHSIDESLLRGEPLLVRCHVCGHTNTVIKDPARSSFASQASAGSSHPYGVGRMTSMPLRGDRGGPELRATQVGAKDWYYAVNGAQSGPFDLNEIKKHFALGIVGKEAYVWHVTFDEQWLPVADVDLFAEALAEGEQRNAKRPLGMMGDAQTVRSLDASPSPAQKPSSPRLSPRLDKIESIQRRLRSTAKAEAVDLPLQSQSLTARALNHPDAPAQRANPNAQQPQGFNHASAAGTAHLRETQPAPAAVIRNAKISSNPINAVAFSGEQPKEKTPSSLKDDRGDNTKKSAAATASDGYSRSPSQASDASLHSPSLSSSASSRSDAVVDQPLFSSGPVATAPPGRRQRRDSRPPSHSSSAELGGPPKKRDDVSFAPSSSDVAFFSENADQKVSSSESLSRQIEAIQKRNQTQKWIVIGVVLALILSISGLAFYLISSQKETASAEGVAAVQPQDSLKDTKNQEDRLGVAEEEEGNDALGDGEEGDDPETSEEGVDGGSELPLERPKPASPTDLPHAPAIDEESEGDDESRSDIFRNARATNSDDIKRARIPSNNNSKRQLTHEQAFEGIKKVRYSVEQCRKRYIERGGTMTTNRIFVEVTVAGSGDVSALLINPESLRNTEFGRCMASHRPMWKFHAFGGPPQIVRRNFIIEE